MLSDGPKDAGVEPEFSDGIDGEVHLAKHFGDEVPVVVGIGSSTKGSDARHGVGLPVSPATSCGMELEAQAFGITVNVSCADVDPQCRDKRRLWRLGGVFGVILSFQSPL